MERVQFQQEQMLEELKDLVEKKIFTQKETKHIIKKRTAFETALVRRVAKKVDFLRYASYEMSLEQLRRKRVERMKSGSAPPTVSDYALVRRQFHIFERALKKFKSDVGLWIQYIQVAKREGARALVGRITARALQLHPNKPALYILAASHELSYVSPSTARSLLQRGIRLNPESVEIWREYVRMELGFIESLRRRWDVLGINAGDKGKKRAHGDNDVKEIDAVTQEPTGDTEDIEEVASRQDIMEGAIVKSVINSAVQALPKIELFESLKTVIDKYPCQPTLRQGLLDFLHDLLERSLPHDAGAIKLLTSRFLRPGLNGEALVEGLRCANEAMIQKVGECSGEDVMQVYVGFVEEWCSASIDENLKHYLVSSMGAVISQQGAKASSWLLSGHIRLLVKLFKTHPDGPGKVLRTARRYTIKAPRCERVWNERLVAERQIGRQNEHV